jgi:putative endonuclease
MPRWHVYLVRCRDGSLYTGITNDLAGRIEKHNSGKGAKYTRSRRPVELVWSEAKRNESYSRKREAELKKLTRTKKLELIGKKQPKSRRSAT